MQSRLPSQQWIMVMSNSTNLCVRRSGLAEVMYVHQHNTQRFPPSLSSFAVCVWWRFSCRRQPHLQQRARLLGGAEGKCCTGAALTTITPLAEMQNVGGGITHCGQVVDPTTVLVYLLGGQGGGPGTMVFFVNQKNGRRHRPSGFIRIRKKDSATTYLRQRRDTANGTRIPDSK